MGIQSEYRIIKGWRYSGMTRRLGNDGYYNAFGTILSENIKTGKIIDVICGHGGSMWLCKTCADIIIREDAKEDK